MKARILVALWFYFLFSAIAVNAQSEFDNFLLKFKDAIKKGDKSAVASLTKFPLSMPYGMKSVKTRTDFFRQFGKIFNGEANAVRCFDNARSKKKKLQVEIACAFKSDPEESENKPLIYTFERTKRGWLFVRFDNINE